MLKALGLNCVKEHPFQAVGFKYQLAPLQLGEHEGEAVLTFTLPPEKLTEFRTGTAAVNNPSEGYHAVIEKGLGQVGVAADDAGGYLRARCAPLH